MSVRASIFGGGKIYSALTYEGGHYQNVLYTWYQTSFYDKQGVLNVKATIVPLSKINLENYGSDGNKSDASSQGGDYGWDDFGLDAAKHFGGAKGLAGNAVTGYNAIPNHMKRHYAHKLSKATGWKSGKIFQNMKGFTKATGKLTSKLGPVGNVLAVGVIGYEVVPTLGMLTHL